MSYKRINNIYSDGFQNHCTYCCQNFPIFRVTCNKNKYKLQLNNNMNVRLFNDTSSIITPYNIIKSVELDKKSNTITFYKDNIANNIVFKGKQANTIFNTLNEYLHSYTN